LSLAALLVVAALISRRLAVGTFSDLRIRDSFRIGSEGEKPRVPRSAFALDGKSHTMVARTIHFADPKPPKTNFPMGITLTSQEREEATASLKKYFSSEMDDDLGDLRAKLLLDYMLQEIAPLAYNLGVRDAEEFFRKRLEDLSATCFEQPFTYWPSKKKK
jgi:uncharacterized protein (DUF2164 family)